MQYRNNAELQDKLAAEYVLGTLRGRARLRFQTWMHDDAALRARVSEWEERLGPMHEAIAEVKPPKRVWRTIQARIARPATDGGFWFSLGFWRNWGLLASGFATALCVTLAAKPMLFNLQNADEMARQMQPSYVATLRATGPQGDEVMFMAYAARQSNQLWVKKVALKAAPAAHSYELWGLPAKSGESPKSLGIIPAAAKGTMQLAAVADKSLSEFPQLAISVEPEGGSQTGVPTGPVIAKGDCHKFW
jgi:anti-sigma-K factor RskA